jgi:hypothetical protein
VGALYGSYVRGVLYSYRKRDIVELGVYGAIMYWSGVLSTRDSRDIVTVTS